MGLGRVMTSRNLGGVVVILVRYTDLSGKEPHRQVNVVRVILSGGVMDSKLVQSARDVRSIPALCAIFP